MTRAITGIVSLVVVACLGLPMLLLTAVMGGGSKGCGAAALPNMHPFGRPPTVGAWDVEQVDVAAIIIDIGVTKGVPRWGWVIAVAAAMQESRLRNLPHLSTRNDHDSIGGFPTAPKPGMGHRRATF
ncbi:hypothetical protein [Micromonospora chalcea]|uniref:hypothetical protein n=1 Tax=Micromonospora chalcea TaxID=1874 RepID=UPI003F49BB85